MRRHFRIQWSDLRGNCSLTAGTSQADHMCQRPDMLQGPLLAVLMQCCSSPSLEVQQLALAALNSLAAVPEHLPAFSRVRRPDSHLAATFCCSATLPGVWQAAMMACYEYNCPSGDHVDDHTCASYLCDQ